MSALFLLASGVFGSLLGPWSVKNGGWGGVWGIMCLASSALHLGTIFLRSSLET